jgi:hypothetical protein
MRIWTEVADPRKHADFMTTWSDGGVPVAAPRDNLLRRKVLLVEVCAFTFQFHTRQQLAEAVEFFSNPLHPSSRRPGIVFDHWWHPWSQRLPKGMTARARRLRVLAALRKALRSDGAAELSP